MKIEDAAQMSKYEYQSLFDDKSIFAVLILISWDWILNENKMALELLAVHQSKCNNYWKRSKNANRNVGSPSKYSFNMLLFNKGDAMMQFTFVNVCLKSEERMKSRNQVGFSSGKWRFIMEKENKSKRKETR